MGTQLTVRMSEDLRRALRATARRMQRKDSEIVRMALREFLRKPATNGPRPADRVRRLIGSIESGIPDLAQRHRELVLESLRRGR